jgi:O-succinylbenzoic acid--CoA ligase
MRFNHPRLYALLIPSRAETVAAIRRVWDGGDAVLVLDPAAPAQERDRLIKTLAPDALIDASGTHHFNGSPPLPAGVAAVVATSGSTGEPKGVMLSWAAMEPSARAACARIGQARGDRWLLCLPLHHVAGLMVLVRAWLAGTEPVVHERFDPALVAQTEDVSFVSLVPTMLAALLDADVEVARYKGILLGGAPVPDEVVRTARRAGARATLTYGMSETCGGCVYDGLPLEGVEMRIGEDSEILLRGPVVMEGYRARPDLTFAAFRDGWFHTNDVGRIEDGRLRVLGRADDMIVTGGEKVAPGEVTAILRQHPDIEDAYVTGVRDDKWGQRVVAYLACPGERPSLEEVRDFVAQRTARYKAPRQVMYVNSVPRTALGKVKTAALPNPGAGE